MAWHLTNIYYIWIEMVGTLQQKFMGTGNETDGKANSALWRRKFEMRTNEDVVATKMKVSYEERQKEGQTHSERDACIKYERSKICSLSLSCHVI